MGVSQGPQGCQASRKSPPWSPVFRDPTGSASFYTSVSFPAQQVSFLCLFFYLQQLTSQVYASLFPSTPHTDQMTLHSNCKFLGQRVITIQSDIASGQIASNSPRGQGPPCVFPAALRANPFRVRCSRAS